MKTLNHPKMETIEESLKESSEQQCPIKKRKSSDHSGLDEGSGALSDAELKADLAEKPN